MIATRFYSTYEELKHDDPTSTIGKQTGFYSTYEELKPTMLVQGRNPQTLFLQYLWGIETDISCTFL